MNDQRRGSGLRASPLRLADAVEIATQVADALAFAHGRKIIHRDIKPHNSLLTQPPNRPATARSATGIRAKLDDFGIGLTVEAAASYTTTGLVMGSGSIKAAW